MRLLGTKASARSDPRTAAGTSASPEGSTNYINCNGPCPFLTSADTSCYTQTFLPATATQLLLMRAMLRQHSSITLLGAPLLLLLLLQVLPAALVLHNHLLQAAVDGVDLAVGPARDAVAAAYLLQDLRRRPECECERLESSQHTVTVGERRFIAVEMGWLGWVGAGG
jgi:hypothetical protein